MFPAVEGPQGHVPIHDGMRAFPPAASMRSEMDVLDRKSERERGKRNERAVCSMELGYE